jgi:hypothetical protein
MDTTATSIHITATSFPTTTIANCQAWLNARQSVASTTINNVS